MPIYPPCCRLMAARNSSDASSGLPAASCRTLYGACSATCVQYKQRTGAQDLSRAGRGLRHVRVASCSAKSWQDQLVRARKTPARKYRRSGLPACSPAA